MKFSSHIPKFIINMIFFISVPINAEINQKELRDLEIKLWESAEVVAEVLAAPINPSSQ